jgi:hypothetical protein
MQGKHLDNACEENIDGHHATIKIVAPLTLNSFRVSSQRESTAPRRIIDDTSKGFGVKATSCILSKASS